MTRPLFEQYKAALRGATSRCSPARSTRRSRRTTRPRASPRSSAPRTRAARRPSTELAGAPKRSRAFEPHLAIAPDDEATLRARAVIVRGDRPLGERRCGPRASRRCPRRRGPPDRGPRRGPPRRRPDRHSSTAPTRGSPRGCRGRSTDAAPAQEAALARSPAQEPEVLPGARGLRSLESPIPPAPRATPNATPRHLRRDARGRRHRRTLNQRPWPSRSLARRIASGPPVEAAEPVAVERGNRWRSSRRR